MTKEETKLKAKDRKTEKKTPRCVGGRMRVRWALFEWAF